MCLRITDQYRCCNLSRKLSKKVFIQVYDYFSKQNLLNDVQYGFRKIHFTELATVELVDRIRLYMDKGQIPLSVFLIHPRHLTLQITPLF